ncbi:hypothetical protein Sgly_1273 [Syntrophobotulus glycolicus DSM 8271]|uniref:Uncharacterized protein n=1 Tax=Syntrophobotulus glycolicus (strain DSM 8271 / FlGlyR) TaxID=645991 RepID=F0SV87_SYNGF|nr:hypothetical protein Sgly_1273 [Syntrophobotulus glycolicus DSM 8271]
MKDVVKTKICKGSAYSKRRIIFSKDELNFIMRRRYSGSSYPEDAKDKKEYAFYKANGVEEAGVNRLLYKYVGR